MIKLNGDLKKIMNKKSIIVYMLILLLIMCITTACSKNVVNEEYIEESAKVTDMCHKDSAACLVDKDGNWIHSPAGYHFTYITCGDKTYSFDDLDVYIACEDKTEVSVKFSVCMFKSGKILKQVESVEDIKCTPMAF